jgi:molecular chaperone Hsp33
MTDQVQRFQLESQPVRGRLARLGPLVSTILERHAYPEIVAGLLGEVVTLAAVLSTGLKYDGVFTLQTSSKGAVRLLVADVTSTGDVRGYAQFDAERLAEVVGSAGPGASVPRLLGHGYLAFTVDQGTHTERYQGIVELTGATLVDCIHHYFRQSEQLDTGIRLAVSRAAPQAAGSAWRAGAIMLQRMPGGSGRHRAGGALAGFDDHVDPLSAAEAADDDWRRALMLLGTASDSELQDPALPANDLLYRLFHEEGVRVFRPRSLRLGCRCSRERVERVLVSLTPEEIATLEQEDGAVVASCEFCNARYRFSSEDMAMLARVHARIHGEPAAEPAPE